MTVRMVVFDVGETLIDEGRLWRLWAKWLDVPPARFLGELESVIQRKQDHRQVFEVFDPGFDLEAARKKRGAAGWPPDLAEAGDLYPDAADCLARLRELGYRTGIAGNQPVGIEEVLREARLAVDVIGSSGGWGVAKPSAAFFGKLQEVAQLAADEIAYVGDRVDADILPALECGMVAVHLERGPWGRIHARWPEAAQAHLRISELTQLPGALAKLDGENARGSKQAPAPGRRPR